MFDRPSSPRDVEFSNINVDSLTINWKPPSHDGAAQISNYIVQKKLKEEDQWIEVASSVVRTTLKVL